MKRTIDLLLEASTFVQASVRTVVGPDGEPDSASDCDAMAHDLAVRLAHEAARLRAMNPAMADALATFVKTDLTEEQVDAAQVRAANALTALPGWKRQDDWLILGDPKEDGEILHQDTIREIAAAALEGSTCRIEPITVVEALDGSKA